MLHNTESTCSGGSGIDDKRPINLVTTIYKHKKYSDVTSNKQTPLSTKTNYLMKHLFPTCMPCRSSLETTTTAIQQTVSSVHQTVALSLSVCGFNAITTVSMSPERRKELLLAKNGMLLSRNPEGIFHWLRKFMRKKAQPLAFKKFIQFQV